jgi:hypothetical protein
MLSGRGATYKLLGFGSIVSYDIGRPCKRPPLLATYTMILECAITRAYSQGFL